MLCCLQLPIKKIWKKRKKEKDATYALKSFETLETEARKTTKENLDNNFSFIAELTREDWFSVF